MAKRTDSNQALIVAAIRDVGASVISLHTVGMGCPDLLVGFRGENFLLEVKADKGTLNAIQRAMHGMWKGKITVVRTPDEALRAIKAIY